MSNKQYENNRSKIMKSIKSQSKLENRVSKALWNKGYRFRKNAKLFGRPDISIQKYKIVIFIDSCFWHNCPIHGHVPQKNREYWESKLGKNLKRDIEVTRYYEDIGWNILRIWEHELNNNFEGTIEKIERFINKSKK